MADHDHVKPNRTISHNLDDRLGATLDERLTARDLADARNAAAREASGHRAGKTGARAEPEEGPPAATRR